MNFGITPVVQRLLIINIAVFALAFLLGQSVDIYRWLALQSIYSGEFLPPQFVTYMFMHGGFMHLFGNMFGLYVFGPMLEHFLGSKKFLILYMVCGIGSGFLYWGVNAYEVHQVREAAFTYMAHPSPEAFSEFVHDNIAHVHADLFRLIDTYADHEDDLVIINQTKEVAAEISLLKSNFSLVGASGSIFGILMAFGLLFPNTEMMLLFPPIPIKAKYLVTAYGAYEFYQQFQNRPDDNIAHFAHLAGMLFAFILIRYWKTDRNSFY